MAIPQETLEFTVWRANSPGAKESGVFMKRNFALIIFVLTCIAVVAVHLGGPAESESLMRIGINFFMFVIPLSAAVLLLLYGLVLILARVFQFSPVKVLRFVCTCFPIPVSIACVALIKLGLITPDLAISCICISAPLALLMWWRK